MPASAGVDPLSLIIEPKTPLPVTRRADGDLVFTPASGLPVTGIHMHGLAVGQTVSGAVPFTLEHASAVVDPAVAGLDPALRYVYTVTLIDGTTHTTAERFLPLTGAFNARDLGGYMTTEGRMVRWGRVYRSSHLVGLTPEDQAYLERLGVRLICDLRLADEAALNPDQPLAGASVLSQPLITDSHKLKQLITVLLYRKRLDKLLLVNYIHNMIDQNAPVFGAVYRRLAAGELPAILHCTAGKDRAGMTTALLLSLLGVPDDTIVADYSLSNRYFEHFRAAAGAQVDKLRRVGIAIDALHPMLLADPNTMRAALAHLRGKYGSVEAYLTGRAGLLPAEIARLRTLLLE